MRKWAGIRSWYPYVLCFFMCAFLFQNYNLESVSREAWVFLSTASRFVPQIVPVLLAMILGRVFRLPRMQIIVYGYALLAVMNMMRWVLSTPSYRIGLFPIAIIVFLLIIAMERTIAWQNPQILKSLEESLPKIMKSLLVIISGAFVVLVIPFSDILRRHWTTASLSIMALSLMLVGFLWQERIYRKTAFGLFAISVFRIVFIDIAKLDIYYRMIPFFALGGCLLLVSILYSRFRTKMQRWLQRSP
jgi:hypothetical protein